MLSEVSWFDSYLELAGRKVGVRAWPRGRETAIAAAVASRLGWLRAFAKALPVTFFRFLESLNMSAGREGGRF